MEFFLCKKKSAVAPERLKSTAVEDGEGETCAEQHLLLLSELVSAWGRGGAVIAPACHEAMWAQPGFFPC